MVLPYADGVFGGVGAVDVGWGVLKFGIVFSDKGFDVVGGFVVKFVKFWSVLMDVQVSINLVISFEEFSAMP